MRAKLAVMFWTLSALEVDLHAPILTSSLTQNFPWPCLNLNTTCGLFCCPAREDRSRVKSCTDTEWTLHFGSWTRVSGRLRVQSFWLLFTQLFMMDLAVTRARTRWDRLFFSWMTLEAVTTSKSSKILSPPCPPVRWPYSCQVNYWIILSLVKKMSMQDTSFYNVPIYPQKKLYTCKLFFIPLF